MTRDIEIVLRDVVLLVVCVLVAALILLLPHIGETLGQDDKRAAFIVEVTWAQTGHKQDVDVYLRDPAGDLVWFRNRGSGRSSLVRDALGNGDDERKELVLIRKPAAGRWTINVHLFDGRGPIDVRVRVTSLVQDARDVVDKVIVLPAKYAEVTIATLVLDADHYVVAVIPGHIPLVPHGSTSP